jgi:hypothetical protein
MNLGNPNAAPVIKAEHDRMRTRSVVDGNGSRPFN